jgi:protein-S-isoprenylcysteine O-methyltransferase Ste14
MMRELGFSCCHLYTSGSWVQECSDLSLGRTITQLLMLLWVAREVFVISLFIVRVKKEDEMLGREFKDWDKWARKVPYKFIPYVY